MTFEQDGGFPIRQVAVEAKDGKSIQYKSKHKGPLRSSRTCG